MQKRAKLITAMGLALLVALSGCGNGKGKTAAATETAPPRTSSSAAARTDGTKQAPSKKRAKGTATATPQTASKQGKKGKSKAPPKLGGASETGDVRPGPGPDTRQECIDYVNGLPFQGADRKRLLGYCSDYPD